MSDIKINKTNVRWISRKEAEKLYPNKFPKISDLVDRNFKFSKHCRGIVKNDK